MNTQLKEVIDLLNTKQYSQAVNKATELVSQSPAEYGTWAVLGAAQSLLHQYDQAVQSFSAAVKRAPNFAPAYNNLGTALQQQLVAWFADFGEEASPDMLKVAFNAA